MFPLGGKHIQLAEGPTLSLSLSLVLPLSTTPSSQPGKQYIRMQTLARREWAMLKIKAHNLLTKPLSNKYYVLFKNLFNHQKLEPMFFFLLIKKNKTPLYLNIVPLLSFRERIFILEKGAERKDTEKLSECLNGASQGLSSWA